MIEVSWVFPCYNEAGALPWLIERLHRAFHARRDVEVILVDNGSTDETPAVLDEAFGRLGSRWRRVDVPRNLGYGHGVCAGLRASTGEYVGWAHADGQVEVECLAEAMGLLEGPQTYVKGARVGRTWAERVVSWGHSRCARWMLEPGLELREINAPPNLFHRSHYASWEAPPADHQLELYAYVMAQRRGARVRFVEVEWRERRAGVSSWYRGLGSRAALSRTTLAYLRGLRRS